MQRLEKNLYVLVELTEQNEKLVIISSNWIIGDQAVFSQPIDEYSFLEHSEPQPGSSFHHIKIIKTFNSYACAKAEMENYKSSKLSSEVSQDKSDKAVKTIRKPIFKSKPPDVDYYPSTSSSSSTRGEEISTSTSQSVDQPSLERIESTSTTSEDTSEVPFHEEI
ncbi:unnamed protein product [Trichobilharzia szidati]|nr:unnamed protein product [Trichobilharzia szidati]